MAIKVRFAVADQQTGAWREFDRELSGEDMAELRASRTPMSLMAERDIRCVGRAMIWELDGPP